MICRQGEWQIVRAMAGRRGEWQVGMGGVWKLVWGMIVMEGSGMKERGVAGREDTGR